jgi:hypothetical protein
MDRSVVRVLAPLQAQRAVAAWAGRVDNRRLPKGGALHVAVIQKSQEAAAGIEAIREAYP